MKNAQSKLGAKALWSALKVIIATEIASNGVAVSGFTFTEADLQRFAGRKCGPDFMEKLETLMAIDEPSAYLSSIHATDTIIQGKTKEKAEPYFEISFDEPPPRITLSDYDQLGNLYATSITAILIEKGLPPLDTTLRITEHRPCYSSEQSDTAVEMVPGFDQPTLVESPTLKKATKSKKVAGDEA